MDSSAAISGTQKKEPAIAEKSSSSSLQETGTRREELELVNHALLCILQEENPVQDQSSRAQELSRRLSGQRSATPLNSKDLSILSRLLSQVHHLMTEGYGDDALSGTSEEAVKLADDSARPLPSEKVIETMVEVAGAAAEAARAAAATAGKNLELVEALLTNSGKTPEGGLDLSDTVHGSGDVSSADTSEKEHPTGSALDEQAKELVKRVERQNTITHWVLGFMVVATAIWRFKMLSMFMGFRNTISNPFRLIGDLFSDGFKWGNKEDGNGAKAVQKARTVLPSLLGSDDKEREIPKKAQDPSEPEEFKIGEALTLSLDNIMSIGKSSGSSNHHFDNEGDHDQSDQQTDRLRINP